MKLYIREANPDRVIVQDRETGYAVAEFFSQRGEDGVAKFDHIALANEFIYAIRSETKSVVQEIGNVGPGASIIGAKFDSL